MLFVYNNTKPFSILELWVAQLQLSEIEWDISGLALNFQNIDSIIKKHQLFFNVLEL